MTDVDRDLEGSLDRDPSMDSAPHINMGRSGDYQTSYRSTSEPACSSFRINAPNDTNEGESMHEPSGLVECEPPDSHSLALVRTIEREIIPRLLQAHRTDAPSKPAAGTVQSGQSIGDISDFARFVMANDEIAIQASVTCLMGDSVSLNVMCLELLAPTARHLGDLWWTDECSFTDVTLALCKLQRVLRDLGDDAPVTAGRRSSGKSILLTAPPTNQHMFGFKMVETFFRRAEWTVCGLPSANIAEMTAAIRRDWFAVLGLSVSCDEEVSKVASLISTLRAASRNRSIVVLVGGPSFTDNPAQALRIGADATAGDAGQAVAQAERLVTTIKRN